MNLKNNLLKSFRNKTAGKLKWQRFFNGLKHLSYTGLNFGDGGSIELSGEINLIKTIVAKNAANSSKFTVFDVGANTGSYCEALVAHLPKNVEIWCFEPALPTFKELHIKFRDNNRVHLNQSGFGNAAGQLKLYTDHPGSVLASLFPLERAHGVEGKLTDFEIVDIKTIDEFATKNNIKQIDFLKLDVEGNEFNALLGAVDLLKSKRIKAIQFEFGTCNIDSRTYFRDFWYLLNENYQLFRIVKDGIFPINKYSEAEEIFQTINYYAELKA